MPIKIGIPRWLKNSTRPLRAAVREFIYGRRFKKRVLHLNSLYPSRLEEKSEIAVLRSPETIWSDLKQTLRNKVSFHVLNVDGVVRSGAIAYLSKYQSLYQGVGNSQEKALEHFLTFELLEMSQIQRHCDVAASRSPFESVFKTAYPRIEYWKQDLTFSTEREKKIIGGFAQKMEDIPNSFFQSLSLHCSFEHFESHSDSEFILEVDRILDSKGVCFIIPLYMNEKHRIFFDPTYTTDMEISKFDGGATLCPTYLYLQRHGRHYSPEALYQRIVKNLPSSLQASLFFLKWRGEIPSELYARFALALHREKSILKIPAETQF